MEFRLLGEIQVLAAGRSLDLGAPRQQAVLAALAVEPGRPVPIKLLVDRIWGDDPPADGAAGPLTRGGGARAAGPRPVPGCRKQARAGPGRQRDRLVPGHAR